MPPRPRQSGYRPATHARQCPHRMNDSTATRSPTSTPHRFAARSPIFSITPSGSCPGTSGNRTGSTPAYCSASLPQIPHASMRRSPLSASTSGIGRSRSSSARGPVCTTARAVRRGGMRRHRTVVVALASDRVDRSGTRPYDPARMPIVPLALRRDPLDALAALAADEPGAFLLDVPDSERPVTLLGCAPVDEARIAADDPAPLATIARIVGAAPPLDASLPFPLAGGTIGYLAYEVGAPRADVRDVLPVATLRRYDPVVAFDRARRQYHLVSSDARTARAPWLERLKAPVPAWTGPIGTAPLRARWSAAAYRDAVARI